MASFQGLRWVSFVVAGFTVSAALGACSTRDLVVKFNSGLLDSAGDPNHDLGERRRALVRSLIVHELMDGYFTQGQPDGDVVRWLEAAHAEPHEFVRVVAAQAAAIHNSLGVVSVSRVPSDGGTYGPQAATARPFVELGGIFHQAKAAAVCSGSELVTAAAGPLVDAIRFDAALERAGVAVSAVVIEGLVKLDDVQRGAAEAFAELRDYIGHRKWQRRFDRHVNAVVVKGGASTGLYSAGVVWVALHLIERCLDDTSTPCQERGGDPRFSLASGTSTGAMVAVAVDVFNTAETAGRRIAALNDLAQWFTCYGSGNLYCVRDGDALDMLKRQTGLVEFDGIERLLTQNVSCDAINNRSELVLNTVDFRTGNLYDLSDQNELRRPREVVQAAIASAVLPFIAKPVPHLPVDYDSGRIAQVYLDGGIRSELPILPMVRRGAERVLVVSSSASITDESKNLQNGMNIAIRYIDISTGGVTESEIAHAERQVEAVRLAEIDTCSSSSAAMTACGGDAGCLDALCTGDWGRVCSKEGPKADGKSRSVLDLTHSRIASLWGARSFFRDEVETESVPGYAFDLTKQRRLFLAGAEAARVRCREIAELLGLPLETIGPKLDEWCAPPLPTKDVLCKAIASSNTVLACAPSAPSAPSAPLGEACR